MNTTYMANKEQPLLEHSIGVAKLCLEYFDTFFEKDFYGYEQLRNSLLYLGLFHDVGKPISVYQDYITKDIKTPEPFLYHNEVAWAYLLENKFKANQDSVLLESIYYTHGTPKYSQSYGYIEDYYRSTFGEISSLLTAKDIQDVDEFYNELINHPFFVKEYDSTNPITDLNLGRKNTKLGNRKIPVLFNYGGNDFFNQTLTLRSIFYSADRFISTLSKEDLKDYLDNKNNLDIENIFSITKDYDMTSVVKDDFKERFEKQQKPVLDEIKDSSKIILMKCPTGFGKTFMGINWILQNKKKTFWVLPDNDSSLAVYENIRNNLDKNEINLSVQLLLSSEVKASNPQCTEKEKEPYNADIVVTNVDNYFSLFYKVYTFKNSLSLLGANVIFDEFHALLSNENLYAFFVELVNTRGLYTKQKTLLLSATPSLCHKDFEESLQDSFQIIPNENEHILSGNTTDYRISYSSEEEIHLPIVLDGRAIFMNTIRQVQDTYTFPHNSKRVDFLYHSGYVIEEKKKLFDSIVSTFGQSYKGQITKTLVTSFVGEKAMDVSYKSAEISLFSFESLLQRIGRVSRWSEYPIADLNIFSLDLDKNRGEAMLFKQDMGTNRKIRECLDTFLQREFSNRQIWDINSLYRLYNEFNKTYANEILEYISNIENKGQDSDNLSYIKFFKYVDDSSSKKAGKGKNLRSNSSTYYYYVRNKNDSSDFINLDLQLDSVWSIKNIGKNPILLGEYNKSSFEIISDFCKNNNISSKILSNILKENSLTPDDFDSWLFKKSKREDCPFFDIIHVYDPLDNGTSNLGIGLDLS